MNITMGVFMKKIWLQNLMLEVTRDCNNEPICKFCLRGQKQDMYMSKEIVDAILNNDELIVSRIDDILFTGGEILLNPDLIEYIVNLIIQKNIPLGAFSAITNGLKLDEKVNRSLKSLYEICFAKHLSHLAVSRDQFHQKPPVEILDEYKSFHFFNNNLFNFEYRNFDDIARLGLAEENNISGSMPVPLFSHYQPSLILYDITKDDKRDIQYVCTQPIYVSSNGNVVDTCDMPYKYIDKLSIGNVSEKTIEDIAIIGETTPKILKLADEHDIYRARRPF